MRTYCVYILASKPYGTLYIGVTNVLLDRVAAHRNGIGSRFTSRYGVKMLVRYEAFGDIESSYPAREIIEAASAGLER